MPVPTYDPTVTVGSSEVEERRMFLIDVEADFSELQPIVVPAGVYTGTLVRTDYSDWVAVCDKELVVGQEELVVGRRELSIPVSLARFNSEHLPSGTSVTLFVNEHGAVTSFYPAR